MQDKFIRLVHKNDTISYVDKDSVRNVYVNEKELKITILYKNLGIDSCTTATCKNYSSIIEFINELRS